MHLGATVDVQYLVIIGNACEFGEQCVASVDDVVELPRTMADFYHGCAEILIIEKFSLSLLHDFKRQHCWASSKIEHAFHIDNPDYQIVSVRLP